MLCGNWCGNLRCGLPCDHDGDHMDGAGVWDNAGNLRPNSTAPRIWISTVMDAHAKYEKELYEDQDPVAMVELYIQYLEGLPDHDHAMTGKALAIAVRDEMNRRIQVALSPLLRQLKNHEIKVKF